jgi:hypothetical protein
VTITGTSKISPICSNRAIDPPREIPIERASGFGFERFFQIFGSGFPETPRGIKPPEPSEEHVVAEQQTKHVHRERAFVVDKGAKRPRFVLDVTEPVPEINRPLIRSVERPSRHLSNNRIEHVFALQLFGVERREILREAFTQPLLVIILPADGLSPPLMRGLVRQEKFREVVEVRRVGAP